MTSPNRPKTRYGRLLSLAFAVMISSTPALAQELTGDTTKDTASELTPRERLVQRLIDSLPDRAPADSEPAPEPGPKVDDIAPTAPLVDESERMTPSPSPLSAIALPTVNEAPARATGFAPEAGRYGFFQTAEDYRAARKSKAAPQLKLSYRVSLLDAKTGIALTPETAVITLGPDYAVLARDNSDTQIFDFKMRRLLTLPPVGADGVQSFGNVSLFGARYQNIDTVRRLTNGGKKRLIDAPSKTRARGAIGPAVPGQSQGLNAFFLESAMGWAAAPLDDPAFKFTRNDDRVEATFDGDGVFNARFNGPEFDTATQGYSFIALMFHSLPAHPDILSRLTDITRAPTTLTLHKVTPDIPTGQKQVWQLTDAVSDVAEFPLPPTAQSLAEQDGVSPLAFVISEALKGGALGGPPDPAATLSAMKDRLAQGDILAVWLSAVALSDKIGGCKALDGLCAIEREARAQGAGDADLELLFTAFDDIETPARRIQGITALRPLLADPDVPGLIMRKVATALSKTKLSERRAAGLSDLNPEALLTQAIAKDPYDYPAYQTLAQIYAARGAFVQSWDMADALRAFPDAPDALKAGFDRAESRLLQGAPGFFPPNEP